MEHQGRARAAKRNLSAGGSRQESAFTPRPNVINTRCQDTIRVADRGPGGELPNVFHDTVCRLGAIQSTLNHTAWIRQLYEKQCRGCHWEIANSRPIPNPNSNSLRLTSCGYSGYLNRDMQEMPQDVGHISPRSCQDDIGKTPTRQMNRDGYTTTQ